MQKKFFNRRIHTIFIMLGNECNLNCRYCLQHPMVTEPISHQINPDIYDFIEQVKEESNDDDFGIQFFGGEPLLFFENIKEITEELERRDSSVRFSLMSNGKTITQEMIDYFNNHHFKISISYDGYNSLKTRGFDPFAKNSYQRDLILQLKWLCLSAVLSTEAYPLDICKAFQELDDEYRKLHNNKHLNLNVDDIFDTGAVPQDLLDIDYNRVEQEITIMAQKFIEDKKIGYFEDKYYACDNFIAKIYRALKYFYLEQNGEYNSSICFCQNGYSTLNLSLNGQLYPCHNTSSSCGSIYDNYFDYLNNLLKYEIPSKFLVECKECSALYYCRTGCKMANVNTRQETTCKLKKAIAIPVLNAIQELSKGESSWE